MTTPNEIALFGLSADGGVTFPNGPDGLPHILSMTKAEVDRDNSVLADAGVKERWCFVSSLPAALNAERNEKAVAPLARCEDYLREARESAERIEGRALAALEVDSVNDALRIQRSVSSVLSLVRAALNTKEGE